MNFNTTTAQNFLLILFWLDYFSLSISECLLSSF